MNEPSVLDLPASVSDPTELEIESILPKVELIESDGEPLETEWHRRAMNVLIASVDYRFRDRQDYYVGGNSFLYYSEEQARNRDFKGPDFFFVWGTQRQPMRPYWAIWLEGGRTPSVVIELCSPTTINADYGEKKDVYQWLRIPEYFCYNHDTGHLDGWRLVKGRYKELPRNEQGRIWSDELELWIGSWQGSVERYSDTWLRFFDSEGNLIFFGEEGASHRAEDEKLPQTMSNVGRR